MFRLPTVEHLALRLEGGEVTFLEKAQGGWISARVEHEHSGPQDYVRKHIVKPNIVDFSIQVSSILSEAFFAWIADTWTSQPPRPDGAILTCDANFAIVKEQAFTNALIQEVAFPALDASSQDVGYLTVRFSPEKVSTNSGSGNLLQGNLSHQKLWKTANFRLEIEGLATQLVRRIEPFAIKRRSDSKAGKIDYPNLIVTLAPVEAQSWIDWHADFVIKGNNDQSHEKEGTIRFLAPNFQTELARIDLHNLGIYRLVEIPGQENQIGSLHAELYCEWMEFHLGES